MMAQIGEVLATYWRRVISDRFAMYPVAALALGIVAVVIVAVGKLLNPVPATRPTEAMLMELTMQVSLIACAALIGPFLIALHFKQQIIQIRQRRIPNAAVAHVIVAMGFLILFAVVLPAVIMALDTWSWGTLGFVLVVTAATFAYYTLLIVRLLILIPAFIFICCFPSVRQWLEELLQGRHEAIGLLLLVVGICGIAGTLVRLLHITEEDRGYLDLSDIRIYSGCLPITPIMHPEASWLLQSALWIFGLGPPTERQVRMWPQWARGSLWQRSKLLSVVYLARSVWPFTVFFFILFSFMYVMPGGRSTNMISNALFTTFFSVFCVVGGTWQQHKFAAIESLRPVGRSQFLIERGLLYASRLAAAWVQVSIAWCLSAYVFVSDVPVLGHQMFNLLVLSAALQVFLFGLSVWVMPSIGPIFTWLGLFALNLTVPFLPWFTRSWYDWRNVSLDVLLWVSPAIVALGALITWDAHRRWMRTELGR